MRQGFPVWERPRQCNSKVVISSITLHHWPGHPQVPAIFCLHKTSATPTCGRLDHIRIISCSCLTALCRAVLHKESERFLIRKQIYSFTSRQSQISWLSKLCKLNVREGLQEKLWIRASSGVLMNKPALPIPSSSAHPSLMISALSTLLPVSYTRARTHTPAQGVAKEMITSFWTSAICAEGVPVKQEEKQWY